MSTVQSLKNYVALQGSRVWQKSWRTVATCLIIFGQFVTQPAIKRTNLARCGSKNHSVHWVVQLATLRRKAHDLEGLGGWSRDRPWNLHFPIANAKSCRRVTKINPPTPTKCHIFWTPKNLQPNIYGPFSLIFLVIFLGNYIYIYIHSSNFPGGGTNLEFLETNPEDQPKQQFRRVEMGKKNTNLRLQGFPAWTSVEGKVVEIPLFTFIYKVWDTSQVVGNGISEPSRVANSYSTETNSEFTPESKGPFCGTFQPTKNSQRLPGRNPSSFKKETLIDLIVNYMNHSSIPLWKG